MTSPKHAESTESGRWYHIPGLDKPLLSVTSVLSVLGKPALPPWAAKLTAERAVKDEQAWHARQQEEGDQAAVNYLKSAPRDYTKAAQDRGTAVHHLCEHWPCECPPEYLGYMQSFEAWLHDYEPEFISRELTVCNPEYGYAGTLDAAAIINKKAGDNSIRRFAECDYKTGNCYPESHALQLAAYRHATHMVVDGRTVPIPWKIEAAGVVELKPRSYKYHPLRTDEYAFKAFLNALQLWHWVNTLSKTAKGEAWA